VVIRATTVIEAAVADLYAFVGIVTGALVRVVTLSMRNGVGAVYGPQATVLSTTLNSDSISVMADR